MRLAVVISECASVTVAESQPARWVTMHATADAFIRGDTCGWLPADRRQALSNEVWMLRIVRMPAYLLALATAKHRYGQRGMHMNSDIFSGKWKQMRGRVKVAWGNLTDDDLDKVNGEYDKFVGLLQEKYGYSRERAEQEVNRHFTAHETIATVNK